MGVWLGKQILGQTDHFYHDINGPQIQIVVPCISPSSRDVLDDDCVTIGTPGDDHLLLP
jgi:hypothetical protein